VVLLLCVPFSAFLSPSGITDATFPSTRMKHDTSASVCTPQKEKTPTQTLTQTQTSNLHNFLNLWYKRRKRTIFIYQKPILVPHLSLCISTTIFGNHLYTHHETHGGHNLQFNSYLIKCLQHYFYLFYFYKL
jgi:hypothetical protein